MLARILCFSNYKLFNNSLDSDLDCTSQRQIRRNFTGAKIVSYVRKFIQFIICCSLLLKMIGPWYENNMGSEIVISST